MLHLDLPTRTAVVGALYTATDVDGGQTKEQRNLLEALARHVMRVPPSAAAATSPNEAAAAIEKPRLRKAVGEILVMLELVRHPPSAPLTARVAEYLAALEIDDGFQQPLSSGDHRLQAAESGGADVTEGLHRFLADQHQ